MKYSIVIPCYNEEAILPNLIVTIYNYSSKRDVEFVLVENGSKDNSLKLMEKLLSGKDHIKLVKVERNMGYGFGLVQGLRAASGNYVGWIHADMQIPIEEVSQFLDFIDSYEGEKKLFIKGTRHNRSIIDYFFTYGMTLFESILFGRLLFDIGAIPVFFDRSLLGEFTTAPKDFSIELFIYNLAKKNKYIIRRIPVNLLKRERGTSSWNTGFVSRIRQSFRIIRASIHIKTGKI